ncbi:hypothetical protein AYO20_05375 [Fonsecaea nubica]|uniref:Acyl-CoA thioesterase II n=1 Tax=Fonsecaea nubica TaxID=856822 RepID=A0A178D1M7_9EURO|nr:hypothetical protein AYO20_05375 [Fonsecaea nubica]OAL35324.1 hypothetical protein AYO20_05375 [Fonsecaea nubica]
MSTIERRSSTEGSQSMSPIERELSLSRVRNNSGGGEEVFTNKAPLTLPPWARGVYGGQIIAQALLAAYETVPAAFAVHSIHCHFLNAATVDVPIVYHVERVRDGSNFSTRVVCARQKQRLVASATASFTRERAGAKSLEHASSLPDDEIPPPDHLEAHAQSAAGQAGNDRPCDCVRSRLESKDLLPHERRARQWVRARGKIGETSPPDGDDRGVGPGSQDGHRAHVAALAYMSDNYFIGTTYRVHNASRFSGLSSPHPMLARTKTAAAAAGSNPAAAQEYFDWLAEEERDDNRDAPRNDQRVETMATLDHTVFFHEPRHFRADEWLLFEMESPWAGHERGLVTGRIWSHRGTLVATCVQEGVARLFQRQSHSKL